MRQRESTQQPKAATNGRHRIMRRFDVSPSVPDFSEHVRSYALEHLDFEIGRARVICHVRRFPAIGLRPARCAGHIERAGLLLIPGCRVHRRSVVSAGHTQVKCPSRLPSIRCPDLVRNWITGPLDEPEHPLCFICPRARVYLNLGERFVESPEWCLLKQPNGQDIFVLGNLRLKKASP